MIDAVLEHLTKDFFPDEPIFRCNIITPESCENLVRFPFPHADIHKHVSWENLTNENQEEIMHWIDWCLSWHKHIYMLKIALRSLGLNLSNETMMWEYKKSLEQGFSIAAVDTEGKILGVRIGVILKK